MTKEEKQLLLKDLCARLPYGVQYKDAHGYKKTIDIWSPEFHTALNTILSDGRPSLYLRSMNTMTKEEIEEFEKTTKVFKYYPGHSIYENIPVFDNDCTPFSTFDDEVEYNRVEPENVISCVDWLNEHHFDYRGLIKKGLALEAPKNMY